MNKNGTLKARPTPQAKRIPYDQSYKQLFSRHDMVESMVRGYVDKKIAEGFDFSTLEEFPTNKIGPFGEEHRNDIIYKCKYNGHDSYILLMLEFQSTIDRFMAVRILAYIACIWLHLSKKLVDGEKLPIFLPIVLYNGTPVWNAPLSFYDLLYEMPEELRPYQGLQYLLLDITHHDKKSIDADEGVSSVLFRMERASTEEEYNQIASSLNGLDDELANMLGLYFATITKHPELFNKALKNVEFCKGDNMILDNLKAMKQQWIAEGRNEGIEKGRKEGRLESDRKRDDGIRNMLKLGKLSVDEIARSFSLPEEHILKLQSQLV